MNDPGDADSVTLRASIQGLAVTIVALVGFDLLAIAVMVLNGFNIVTALVALLAAMSTIVIGLDLPVSATFDHEGVERVTPLRRHRIRWEHVDRVARMRRGGIRRPGSEKYRGIIAIRGHKRSVLVDRTVTDDEQALLRFVLDGRVELDTFKSLGQPGDVDTIDPDRSAGE